MSKTLATVNGKVITDGDIDFLLSTLPPQQAATYSSPEARKGLLEELIAHELFFFDAQANNVEEEEAFQAELAIAKEKLLKSYSIAKLLRQAVVTDEDAKEFYDASPENFQEQEHFSARHILVATKEEHDFILKQLHDGASFEEMAKEHSTCPSKERGGDLGTFSKGQMVKEFDEALETMEIGEIRGDVKTTYGYHIVELTNKTTARTIPYEEVKEKIKSYLLSTKQNDLFVEKVTEMREKYPVLYMD